MNLDYETIQRKIGFKEDYQAPETLMNTILNKQKREAMFSSFLDGESDLSYDWFHVYFQEQQANRKGTKQDFTPEALTTLANLLAGSGKSMLDPAAGTGGLTISQWNINKDEQFQMEELSESAIPFLVFNCAIRNMNAVIINGDTLERKANQIFMLNSGKQFSRIDVLPHTKEVASAFDISEWEKDSIELMEFSNWQGQLPTGNNLFQSPADILLDI